MKHRARRFHNLMDAIPPLVVLGIMALVVSTDTVAGQVMRALPWIMSYWIGFDLCALADHAVVCHL